MGSGQEAERDSSRVVDLTEQILDAGLSGRMAVQLLNSLIGAEGDEERMAHPGRLPDRPEKRRMRHSEGGRCKHIHQARVGVEKVSQNNPATWDFGQRQRKRKRSEA